MESHQKQQAVSSFATYKSSAQERAMQHFNELESISNEAKVLQQEAEDSGTSPLLAKK